MQFRKKISLFLVTLMVFVSLISPVQAADFSQHPAFSNPSYDSVLDLVKQIQGDRQTPAAAVTVPENNDKQEPVTDGTTNQAELPNTDTPAQEENNQDPGQQKPEDPAIPDSNVNQLSEFELKVVELVNSERAKEGLPALKIDVKVARGARQKSEDMRDNRYFSHTSPKYGSPFKMMTTLGIKWRAAGENIASGYRTPESVVKGWMNSPGHRANILSPKWNKIGVGYAKGGKSGHYWTQWFIKD